MRKVLWTVFLVVAIQGMAAASTALASPTAERTTAAETLSVPERTTARFDADALKTRPSLQTASERKVPRSQSEVLSKNFSNPKPVQIYWFFGGR